MRPRVERLVALGASNLTRALPAVLGLARQAFGAPLEVVAALGLGRSYGQRSSIPNPRLRLRALPGVLESALFERLARAPRVPTLALLTDVGNDVAYGVPVDVIASWVETCITRLQTLGAEVVLTDLPLDSLLRISPARYALLRALLLPSCRLTHAQALERATATSQALRALATRHGLRFVELRREWYGLDPIHVRRRCWTSAWGQILLGREPDARPDARHALQLLLAAPERQWLAGRERRRAQPAVRLADGSAVSFY